MHLTAVYPGHKGRSLRPSFTSPTGQGWVYTCSSPHRLSGCIYLRAKWVPLSGSCCGVAETLRQEARSEKHGVWQGPVRCIYVNLPGYDSTEHVTKMLCFLRILHLFKKQAASETWIHPYFAKLLLLAHKDSIRNLP